MSAAQAKPDLRIVAGGADVSTVFDKVRDMIADQREKRALTELEAAGAHWATDTIEALERIAAKKRLRDCGMLTREEVDDLMLAGVRGG